MDRAGSGFPARRAVGGRRRGLPAVALALVVLGLAAPSAIARPKHKQQRHGADLIVTRVKDDAGSPPYLVENADGTTQDFAVTVTIKNIGDRPAARSLTKVVLESGPLRRSVGEVVYPVGPLAAGKSHTITLPATGIKVRLGLLDVVVTPNYNFHVPELKVTNNRHLGGVIPVVAQQWDVINFNAHEVAPLVTVTLDDNELAQDGFFFKFDHFDRTLNEFVYTAYGDFKDTSTYTSSACSGAGSGTAGHHPWASPSGLKISYDLTEYFATLDTSREDNFTFSLTCANSPAPQSHTADFFDPLTYAGRPGPVSMTPPSTTLDGSGAIPQGFATVTHAWHFAAHVP